MRKVALFVAVILLGSLFTGTLLGCSQDAEQTIIIGYLEDTAPLSFVDSDGLASGFDAALASAVFDKLGIDVEFKAVKNSEKEKALAEKEVDILWGGIVKSEDMEEDFLISRPYLKNSIAVAVRLDSAIEEISNIPQYAHLAFPEEMSSFVYGNTTLGSRITKSENTFTYNSTIKLTATAQDALSGIKSGEYTAAVADMLTLLNFTQKEGGFLLNILEPPLGENEYTIVLRKGEEALMYRILTALYELQESRYLSNLAVQWSVENYLETLEMPQPPTE